MTRPVVTISRQHASRGEAVAVQVAERLGVPLLEEEIGQRAAARSGVDEATLAATQRPVSFMSRMWAVLGSMNIPLDPNAAAFVPEPAVAEVGMPAVGLPAERLRAILAEVVRDAAAAGAVIVGYAAHLTLREHPGVVRVLVQAPLAARVRRLVHTTLLTPAEAQRQIEEQDRERVRFYQETYRVQWYDTRLYDCIVDTERLGVAGAVATILDQVGRLSVAPPDASPVRLTAPSRGQPGDAAAGAPEPRLIGREGVVVALREGEVRLRPMGSGDGAQLLALFRTLPPEDLLFLRRDVTDPLVVEAWERDVADGRMVTLLAETVAAGAERAAVVGEASLQRSEVPWTRHVGEVRVITAPAYRERGLGGILLQTLLRAAAAAGIEQITAQTLAEQAGARRLLARLGFAEAGRYGGYARDLQGRSHDLIVLTCTTPPPAAP